MAALSKPFVSSLGDGVERVSLACADHPAAKEAVPGSQFTSTMSAMASSISVVTAAFEGERQGRTVTAMLSLSAEPPAVLVSITRDSDLAAIIERSGGFSLALLSEDQREVADSFAGFGPADRYLAGEWDNWPSGHPRLLDAMAGFDCQLGGIIEMDTHLLYAGIVTHTHTQPNRRPLLWHRRGYSVLDSEGA